MTGRHTVTLSTAALAYLSDLVDIDDDPTTAETCGHTVETWEDARTTIAAAARAAVVADVVRPVTHHDYADVLSAAWRTSPNVAAALTDYRDPATIPVDAAAYLTHDAAAGFIVCSDGELVGLFSSLPGRGASLVAAAIAAGAVYLDCFDGYLPTLYARHGFAEVRRDANWTPGGPDVVYMSLPGYSHRHGA